LNNPIVMKILWTKIILVNALQAKLKELSKIYK